MNDERVKQCVEVIRRQMAALQRQATITAQEEIEIALDVLQLVNEEKQACLEVRELIEETLLAQNQDFSARYEHYYNLFQSLPIAYLVTSASGLILEANQAIATLLNVTQQHLIRKPLAAIEQHRPDVLVSDIRMADQDGYALIRRVRELEAQQGGHVPAAALTSYLDESREKALTAGFEAHLHKLVQPSELVKLVSQLSGRNKG